MVPLVSVILATFNRANYLRESINSVLGQSLKDLELVIVDDGSTDGTAELIKSEWSDSRIVYEYQKNQGFSAARNQALTLARGEYLAFLDSDDKYFPDTLASHLEIYSKNKSVGLTVGGYEYIDEASHYLGERRPWLEGPGLDLSGWLFNCYTVPSAAFLHRSWYERVGGFDETTTAASDWDLFLRLALAGCNMAWVPKSVCQYRLHASNMSRDIPVHRAGALKAVRKVFQNSHLPPNLAGSENKVTAWVHVVYAKRAISANLPQLVAEDLCRAVQLDPDLKTKGKVELLEYLLTPEWTESAIAKNQAVQVQDFPACLGIKTSEIHQALARVQMSQFFKRANISPPQAAFGFLMSAVKYDPAWLANRGVLAFLIRYILGGHLFSQAR